MFDPKEVCHVIMFDTLSPDWYVDSFREWSQNDAIEVAERLSIRMKMIEDKHPFLLRYDCFDPELSPIVTFFDIREGKVYCFTFDLTNDEFMEKYKQHIPML